MRLMGQKGAAIYRKMNGCCLSDKRIIMQIEEILKEYSLQLRRFLSSRIRNRHDVDDVLQEILIKTFQHFQNIREPEKFKAWLFKTARNTLIDYYRRSDKNINGELTGNEVVFEPSADVRQDLAKCIRPFLKNLPEKYRVPLEAVELQEVSQKELAESLGLSYSALKSRVQRGRKMLLNILKECCHYEFDVRGNIMSFKAKKNFCKSC